MRLKTLCPYNVLLGRVQTTSLTSGFDFRKDFEPIKILILAKGAHRHPIKGKK